MSQLIQEISLKDTGYSKGIKSAQAALEKLAKENGVANASFRNTNKEVNSAKRYFSTLSVEYSKLSDQAKKSEFGKAIHRQMEQAQRDLQDMYTATEKVNQKLRDMQETARRKANINVDTGGFSMKQMGKDIAGRFGLGELTKVTSAKQLAGLGAMAGGVAAATAAVTSFSAALENNIETARQFEKSASSIKALTGADEDTMKQLKTYAIELGGTTTQTASQVIDAFGLIGSQAPSLLKDAEALSKVTEYSIMLSEAAGIDLADAAKAVTGILNQFSLSAGHAKEVVNLLAAASQQGAGDVNYLNKAIVNSGSVAGALGVEVNETVAAIEMLAQAGIDSSSAGNQLKNIMLKLEASSDKNLKPSINGLIESIKNLSKMQLSSTEMSKMFGTENVAAALTLVKTADAADKLSNSIKNTNTAEEQQRINNNNLDGSLKNLSSKWEAFNLALNQSNGLIKIFVDGLAGTVGWFTKLISKTDSAAEALKRYNKIASGGKDKDNSKDGVSSQVDKVAEQQTKGMMIGQHNRTMDNYRKVLADYDKKIANLEKETSTLGGYSTSQFGTYAAPSQMASLEKKRKELEKEREITVKNWKEFIDKSLKEIELGPKSKRKNTTDIPTGTTDTTVSTTSSKTTNETPAQKYENSIAQINALEKAQFYDIDDSISNEKKAIEEKIKATDEYIRQLNRNATEVERNQAIVKQLNEKQRAYKDRLKAINVEYADNKTIKDANEAYAEKIEQLNRDRENGWITENEYSSEYIKAMKDLVQKYKSVTNVSDELKKTIDTKTAEIDRIELGGKLNDLHATVDSLNEDIIDIVTGEPRANQNYRKYKEIDNKIFEKLNEAEFKKDVYGTSGIGGNGKQLGQSDVIDFIQKYGGSKFTFHLFSAEDIGIISSIQDKSNLTKEQFEAIDRVIQRINHDLSEASNGKKTWENEWLTEYKSLVEKYRKYASSFQLSVNSVEDAENLNAASNKVITALNDKKSILDKEILGANEMFDPEGAKSQFEYLKRLWQDLMSSVKDDGFQFNLEPQNIEDLYDEISKLTPEVTAKIKIDEDSLRMIQDEISYVIDSTANSLLSPDSKIEYDRKYGYSMGDKSNYSLTSKSYDRVSRENTLSKPMSNIDKYYDKLNQALDKYKEMEQKMLEIDALGGDNGISIDNNGTAFLDSIESEIKHYHDKIQKNLNFRMAFDGINETMEGLNDIGNVAMMWDNLGESLDNAKNGFERFMTVFQAVISTFQTVGSIIETVNTVVSLFSAISGAATQQKIAEAGANKALETTTLDLAAAQIFAAHASIPFAGPGIASGLIAQMLSTMAATQAATLAMAAYANGGIVGGDSFHGDTTLVRANKGEMVLNNLQQRNLFSLLDGAFNQPFGGGSVDFKISGDALYGTLKNYKKIKGKTGHIISL